MEGIDVDMEDSLNDPDYDNDDSFVSANDDVRDLSLEEEEEKGADLSKL